MVLFWACHMSGHGEHREVGGLLAGLVVLAVRGHAGKWVSLRGYFAARWSVGRGGVCGRASGCVCVSMQADGV